MTAPLRIETIVSAPFAENSYVVWRANTRDAIVVDPGFDPDAIIDVLRGADLTPVAILNTHGHSDHIVGNGPMLDAYPGTPLIIGRNEAYLLSDANANLSAPFGFSIVSPPADQLVDDGERLTIAGIEFLVREIPGHSPGSVVYIADGESPPIVLVGDVIFAGSVGRTDFPGGSTQKLLAGIKKHLFSLPDDTLLYPGHGPTTTVGQEKATNPYCRQ